MNDATVAAVSTNCPELTVLCLSKCDNITDDALTMLSQGCTMLTFVSSICARFVCLLNSFEIMSMLCYLLVECIELGRYPVQAPGAVVFC